MDKTKRGIYMNMFKWSLMSKHQKLMYSLPIYRSNKQRVHLVCGMILDFTDNTIKYKDDKMEVW